MRAVAAAIRDVLDLEWFMRAPAPAPGRRKPGRGAGASIGVRTVPADAQSWFEWAEEGEGGPAPSRPTRSPVRLTPTELVDHLACRR
jgi:hypothetical protein